MINIFLSQHSNKCGEIFNELKKQLISMGMDKSKASTISTSVVLYGLMSGGSTKEIEFGSKCISKTYISGECSPDDRNLLYECLPYLMTDIAKFRNVKPQALRFLKLTADDIISTIYLNSEKLLMKVNSNKISSAISFLKIINKEQLLTINRGQDES